MAEQLRQQYIDSILMHSEQESQSQRTFLETLSLEELEELNIEIGIENAE
jgi:hypothetical protein